MTAALVKHPPVDETAATPSMIPAIDQVITRLHGCGLISQHDVVDLLLDLRLVAKAQDIVEGRDGESRRR
jgi:hypothetical protein